MNIAGAGGGPAASTPRGRVAVVVLGDLGRSPRMQCHARALGNAGFDVDLIGYAGRPPDDDVAAHPRIRIHLLTAPWRQRAPRWLFVPVAAVDVAVQAAALASVLAEVPRPDFLLTQNPPTFPTAMVAPVVAWARGARWVIDWHNFGGHMLALRFGRGHPLVRLACAAERMLGQRAAGHLCVSEAMRLALAAKWGVGTARVLRDRPARRLGRTPPAERARLFERLGIAASPPPSASAGDESPERLAVIVTSSSWTADEDFSLLLEAMACCDAALARGDGLPRMLFVMTGEGPLRRRWERRIEALGLKHVLTHALWVSAADYPRVLGAAALGVSLHRSASGVDLPMKISDMFGAGIPVCALAYGPVVSELVRTGENGLLFLPAPSWASSSARCCAGFPGAPRYSTSSAAAWIAWPPRAGRTAGSARRCPSSPGMADATAGLPGIQGETGTRRPASTALAATRAWAMLRTPAGWAGSCTTTS